MNSRSSNAAHASSFVRRQLTLHILLLIGMCASGLSLVFPWVSRGLAVSVSRVEQLHRASGPFAPLPTDSSVHVFAGMNGR